jgi:hypothetical protein
MDGENKLFLEELLFMEKYIQTMWESPLNFSSLKKKVKRMKKKTIHEKNKTSADSEVQNQIEETTERLIEVLSIIESYRSNHESITDRKEKLKSDPIAYFNCEGEKVCILKSTIQKYIPESQLAIRLSGEWVEQDQDLDEDGCMDVDFSKEVFRAIISAVRSMKYLAASQKPEIKISKAKVDELHEALNYFLIDSTKFVISQTVV